ncbi:MAG: DNA primase [Rhodobacterales bacterium]|nr:DNA primase [Rhodobacterales bacterium]
MSLPPGFLDELRARVSVTQVVGRKVTWDHKKSNQNKGDMWAPCPFHQEKTASFHVDDQKGFYYCFGCHAKGDAISFVKETENVNFIEAVEILAKEAGLQMPEQDPLAKEKSNYRDELFKVMELSVRFYQRSLNSAQGLKAREYIDSRKLSSSIVNEFELGFASNNRTDLFDYLRGKEISEQHIIDTGMCLRSDEGGAVYDRFRDRIMYPIRDSKGRYIAFGGRAMSQNARAKYLNSPETKLFDKGRSLYNFGSARSALSNQSSLIVAEGYMDVIALSQANFKASVAPLGTAITKEQLGLIWRISPNPVVALDGDRAGINAAYRLIDVALPLIETGKTITFAILPEGYDPDDLIKERGRDAMQLLVEEAITLADLIWKRETEGLSFNSPDSRAALDKKLNQTLSNVRDSQLKYHYQQYFKELKWQTFVKKSGKKLSDFNNKSSAGKNVKDSFIANSETKNFISLKENVILAILIKYPSLIDLNKEKLITMHWSSDDHSLLLEEVMEMGHLNTEDITQSLESKFGDKISGKIFNQKHVTIIPCLGGKNDVKQAALILSEEINKLQIQRGLDVELAEVVNSSNEELDETAFWRLGQATQIKMKANKSENDGAMNFEIAPNGAKLNKDEKSQFDALLEEISTDTFNKSKNREN